MTRPESEKKESLEKQYAFYSQQYQAANNQLLSTLAWDQKISIKQNSEYWFTQMQEAEAELKALEHKEKSPAEQAVECETHLPYIDFTQPDGYFTRILSDIGEARGAALFVLQNCYLMGGDWFLRRIKERLKFSGHLREFTVGSSEDMRPDEGGVISRLAEGFGLCLNAEDLDWQQGAAQIIDYLCGEDVVRTRDIIFLEIHGWDDLLQPDAALDNFIEGFWAPLVRRLPTIAKYDRFKFLAFITAEDTISWPASVCDNVEAFCPEQALELQLTRWTSEEIRELCEYSRRPSASISQMMPRIQKRCHGGIPRHAWTALRDYLENH